MITSKPMELPPNMEMVGERLGGARVFEFWCFCNVLYTIGTGSMRHFQWLDHAVIAPKPMKLPPNMEMVGERLRGAPVFEFWCYFNVLYTSGTGSMRRFQWYRPRCESIKTHGANPKYGTGGGKAWWGSRF